MNPTDHPLSDFLVRRLWDGVPRSVVAFEWEDMNAEEMGHALTAMRATFDAGREHEREHADPHHDPRPWQDCTREDIRAGDLVEMRAGDSLYVGVAHRQDDESDWWTKDGYFLTDGDRWSLRRIPAPTPPAEEVALPIERPAHITDVEDAIGIVCAYMAKSLYGVWIGVDQGGETRNWVPRCITAFTLPDGTRARRNGEHEDGTPRFVKEDA